MVEQQLSVLYRKINRFSDLFWGVDKDLDEIQNKRRRVSLTSFSSFENNSIQNVVPDTVSLGYGELRIGQFSKIISYLMNDVTDELKMSDKSSFLDIGSGYGKCIMHARIQAGVAKCDGIEYNNKRYECSEKVLRELSSTMNLEGVTIVNADATEFQRFDYTHVYMFDAVFNEETHSSLFEIIENSYIKMLICYCRPEKAKRLGLKSFQQIHKISVKSTGGESFTVRFYIKE